MRITLQLILLILLCLLTRRLLEHLEWCVLLAALLSVHLTWRVFNDPGWKGERQHEGQLDWGAPCPSTPEGLNSAGWEGRAENWSCPPGGLWFQSVASEALPPFLSWGLWPGCDSDYWGYPRQTEPLRLEWQSHTVNNCLSLPSDAKILEEALQLTFFLLYTERHEEFGTRNTFRPTSWIKLEFFLSSKNST
jgi:hypothetical protein